MERKFGLSLVALLGGLAFSCVSSAEVDEEGTESDGQDEASASSGSGGSDRASAVEGSGGTQSAASTSDGPTGDSSTVGAGGTGAGDSASSGSSESTSGSSDSTNGQQTTGEGGGQSTDDICPFDAELEYDPEGAYPFCEGTESFPPGMGEPLPGENEPIQNRCREQVPGSVVGLGRIAWSSVDGSPDEEPLQFCLCTDECETDSDCPAGDTGNAEAACITRETQKHCFLTCDNDETCPDGMICTQGHDLEQRVCAWGTRANGCDTSEWPNVTNPEP